MQAETFRVEHLLSVGDKTVMVFYTSGKCYQFRILHQNGTIEGSQHLFYTREAALTAARQSLTNGLV